MHRMALVVAPKTLLAHWEKELAACGLSTYVHQFTGTQVSRQVAAFAANSCSLTDLLMSTLTPRISAACPNIMHGI